MIYHYCDAAAFKSIVEHKQVWLSDITKLNDTSEYKVGFNLIQNILIEKGLENEDALKNIHPEKMIDIFQILICCFSLDGDSGSQWRLYADDSKGLSIGFDERAIETNNMFNRYLENNLQPITSRVKIQKVNYDKLAFLEQARHIIDTVMGNGPALKHEMIALSLCRLCTIYKDSFFKDECEIRAIVEIRNHNANSYNLDDRTNVYQEHTIYHKLLTSFQDSHAIKEVIIGANCQFTEVDVKGILQEHGLEEVRVRYSSGRGRYRTPPKSNEPGS